MPTVKRKERPPTDWVKAQPETLAAWGPSLVATTAEVTGADEPDAIVVGGLRLVRGPDGNLYGIVESTAKATS